MKQGPRLELRAGQSLVMTQQLQQSIKLLQCNSLELKAFIAQELEKNPFLMQEDPDAPEEQGESTAQQDDAPREADFSGDEVYGTDTPEWQDDQQHIERDYLQGTQHSTGSGGDYADDDMLGALENKASDEKTLREHLLEQVNLDLTGEVQKMVAAHLVDMVDDAGYLKDPLDMLAESLGLETEEVETVLMLLQRFDPPGVFARSLKECLALQLKDKNRLDPAMETLLDNLDLLGGAKFDELQRRCGVDKEDLRQMVAEIKELNPKPGAGFTQEVVQVAAPDIFVRRMPDGNWHVELNMDNFPKVMVNRRYYKTVSKNMKDAEDKKYLSEQFGSANWLVRALEQRADTMLKVGGELVKQQDAFFRLGVRYLKPMTLKDIAKETGYHESTISRVTSGKFLVCPRGTFELKYFFTSSLSRALGGEDVSSQAVKDYIAELIESERSGDVLSDDEIARRLKDRNISVARRTVAKYREAMNIPSSSKRRRLKLQSL
ncbi:MAG: RNA polymerase factor sigma-54 [Alphaproteobacteria bacterium]